MAEVHTCSYCEREFAGAVEWSIHRDGFGEGPEVVLCEPCAAYPHPTPEEIWARLAERDPRELELAP